MTEICNHFEKNCQDSVLNLPYTKSSQYVFLKKDLEFLSFRLAVAKEVILKDSRKNSRITDQFVTVCSFEKCNSRSQYSNCKIP